VLGEILKRKLAAGGQEACEAMRTGMLSAAGALNAPQASWAGGWEESAEGVSASRIEPP